MELVSGIAAWFADPEHWQGPTGVPTRLLEHVALSAAALLVASLIGLPLGMLVGHTRRGTNVAINIANLGRSLPTLAIMGIVLPLTAAIDPELGFKVYPAVIALIVLAIPPILVNAFAGLVSVDQEMIEAGRAMGMRATQLLTRVELPIALPVILLGLRSAASQILATATLAAIFGGPGLGRYLVEGYAQLNYPMMFAGVILVGVLFIVVELAFTAIQRALTSPGLRVPKRTEPVIVEPTLGA